MDYKLDELLESIAQFARRVETNLFLRAPEEKIHNPIRELEGNEVPPKHQPENPKLIHDASSKDDVCQMPIDTDRREKSSKGPCIEKEKPEPVIIGSKKRRNKRKGSKKERFQQKHKKRKEYLGVIRACNVKHKNTIVRFYSQDNRHISLQKSQEMCVFCQISFHSKSMLQKHFISTHGDKFDLSSLLKINNRNHIILRNVVQVELKQLPRANICFLLKITNLATVTLLLKSIHLFDGKEALIPIFALNGVLRMASGYIYEDEFYVQGLHLVDDCVFSLFVIVHPIDGERLPYDIIVQYHLQTSVKKNNRIVGTNLKLEKLPPYVIPEEIKILYENNFRKRGSYGPREQKILRQVEVAKKPLSLSIENYTKQLTVLNQIEAEYLRCEFESYTVEQPKFNIVKRDRKLKDGLKIKQILYAISIDQFQNRPSLIEEDIMVHLSVKVKQTVEYYQGIVENVEPTRILILLDNPIERGTSVLRIEFHFSKITFQLEQQALSLLSTCRKEHIVFPSGGELKQLEEFKSFNWIRTNISTNQEQMIAVRNIVNRTSFPAPYVLFGPPGTGKSSTLVEAIGQIYRLRTSANILLVTPSNIAANEISTRLLVDMPEKSIYRFFSRICLRKVDDINADILKVSNLIDKEYDLPCYEDIYLARVVVATMSTAGRLVQANIVDKHFSYVIIDECGSAKEISALVPIGELATCGEEIHASIVLAGDPKQLGPVIRYDFLKQTTHCISLLERIMKLNLYSIDPKTKKYNTRFITQLRNNFRSHKMLLDFSNSTFYNGQLRAKASPEITNWALGWHRLPNPKCPLIFCSVSGKTQKDNNGFSLYNAEEGEVIMGYVKDILFNRINGRNVKQSEIGIISPYARQVLHLKELCKLNKFTDIEIGSAEQYQGREKDIIIISTVRSQCNHIGFLSDFKRLNVTTSRAKALMIVVGDAKTLGSNKHWKKLIEYCRKNKAYVDIK